MDSSLGAERKEGTSSQSGPETEAAPSVDPYSLDTLREYVAVDAVASIIDRDPQGFLDFLGLPGEVVELIKPPDTFFVIAENNIKVTAGGRESFLNLYIATNSATVDISKLLVDFTSSKSRYGLKRGEAIVALLWDLGEDFHQPKFGEVTETAHEGGRPMTRAQYADESVTFRFSIMRFSDRSPEEILAGPPALYPFLGLTKIEPDELSALILRLQQATAALPHDRQREIWMRMRVFMELRFSVEETNRYLNGVWPMTDLKQSHTYRVIVEEGRVDGKLEMVKKLLDARFGQLPDEIAERVELLASIQLDDLAVQIITMSGLPDVANWLSRQ